MLGRRTPAQEFVAFLSTAGQPVRLPFGRAPIDRTIEYQFGGGRRVDTIGALIDVAIGAAPSLCDHGLLDPADLGRLAAFAHDFRGFRWSAGGGNGGPPAGQASLDRIGKLLRAWVLDKFDTAGRVPALFALEAGFFIESIAFGADQSYPREHRWRLTGVAASAARDDGLSDSADFKRKFTRRLGGLTLLARATEDLVVRPPGQGRTVIPAGREFRFTTWNCPLSDVGPDHVEFLVPRWELLRGCWPFGAIPFDDGGALGREDSAAAFTVPAHGNLPLRWVTHSLDPRGEAAVWAPVPTFPWEIGS